MSKQKKDSISPVLIVGIAIIVGVVSFYLGIQYTSLAQAAKGGKNIFEGYADCSNYKQDPTDTTPPSITIVKPADGAVISGIKGNDIFWVSVKVTDDKGYVYPSLYVNDLFKLSTLSFIISNEDPTIRSSYIHVKPNQTYTLKAKACDNGGNESWSTPVKFTTAQ